MRSALRLPELVHAILLHLGDDLAALFAAIRVSRTWFSSGVGMLWNFPHGDALDCVAPARRQFYADMIAHLDSPSGATLHRSLSFPRLRKLCTDADDARCASDPAIVRLISPRLEEIHCAFARRAVERVMAECLRHRLRRLRFFAPSSNGGGGGGSSDMVSISRFIDWLTKEPLPQLQSFELLGVDVGSQRRLDRLLCFLAQCQRLEDLLLRKSTPEAQPATLAKILLAAKGRDGGSGSGSGGSGGAAPAMQPFGRLRDLGLTVHSAAVPALARLATALTSLDLRTDGARGVFAAIASLTQLVSLILNVGREAVVQRDDLVALARLAQLQHLTLWAARTQGLTGAEIVRLLPAKQQLETLGLLLQLPREAKLMGRIGAACPALTGLALAGNHCLDLALDIADHASSPLFPKLEVLRLGRAVPRFDIRYVATTSRCHDLSLPQALHCIWFFVLSLLQLGRRSFYLQETKQQSLSQ